MVRLIATGRSTVVFGICSLAIALVLVAGAAPAGAVVANIGGHGYGVAPINGVNATGVSGADGSGRLGRSLYSTGAGNFD